MSALACFRKEERQEGSRIGSCLPTQKMPSLGTCLSVSLVNVISSCLAQCLVSLAVNSS